MTPHLSPREHLSMTTHFMLNFIVLIFYRIYSHRANGNAPSCGPRPRFAAVSLVGMALAKDS
jgi:hypothetical protein